MVPADASEVGALMRKATKHGFRLTFRSGGTSLSGQASTDGVLVDARRNIRSIEILNAGLKVRCQPGATVRQVNSRLARHQRKLGPDPASEIACTIGGVVANNSSGMACGTEGNAYHTIDSAVLVHPSGTVIDTASADADDALKQAEPALYDGLLRLRDKIISSDLDTLRIRELFSIKNTMGYGLNSLLDFHQPFDILLHLAVGSEATLAFLVEVAIPVGISEMCCGTPWTSKGMTDGHATIKAKVLPATQEASRHGQLPVVCDAASCTEGLNRLVGGGGI